MDRTEILARRERLYRPPGGRVSSELEVLAAPALRKKRLQQPPYLHLIQRWDRLCDADLEPLKPEGITHNSQDSPLKSIEPPVLAGFPVLTIQRIAQTVARYYGVTVLDIVSQRRHADIMRPRQVTYYLCKTLTTRSLPEIGRRLGYRDHTTIISGCRKITRLLPIDPTLEEQIEAIKTYLLPAPTAVPIE